MMLGYSGVKNLLSQSKWLLTKEEQNSYINTLTQELLPLRAKAGISQGELATLVGISRQTYSSIESGKRNMSWNTYLSLIFFFDYNVATHQMIHKMGAFPDALVQRYNADQSFGLVEVFEGKNSESAKMLKSIDSQGLHAVEVVIKMEYERCQKKASSK